MAQAKVKEPSTDHRVGRHPDQPHPGHRGAFSCGSKREGQGGGIARRFGRPGGIAPGDHRVSDRAPGTSSIGCSWAPTGSRRRGCWSCRPCPPGWSARPRTRRSGSPWCCSKNIKRKDHNAWELHLGIMQLCESGLSQGRGRREARPLQGVGQPVRVAGRSGGGRPRQAHLRRAFVQCVPGNCRRCPPRSRSNWPTVPSGGPSPASGWRRLSRGRTPDSQPRPSRKSDPGRTRSNGYSIPHYGRQGGGTGTFSISFTDGRSKKSRSIHQWISGNRRPAGRDEEPGGGSGSGTVEEIESAAGGVGRRRSGRRYRRGRSTRRDRR